MEKDYRKILGRKAKEIRKKLKLRQEDVANAIDFPRTDISGFESQGERITTIERIEKLFNFYGYTILEPSQKKLLFVSHKRGV
jgi:transcriptional regulator with XRE-family HTH domain